VTWVHRFAEILSDAIARTSAFAPVALFLASFVEYVFPPAPGDLLVVLGSWYAVQGALSWPAVFLVVTAGAIAGAWIDHRIGAALGRGLERRAARHSVVSADRLVRFEASYRRWGVWLLVANRFLPGVRAFLFVAAGASGIPLRQVLVYGGISAAVWNVFLLSVGALVAHSSEELVAFFDRYTAVAWVVLAVAALAALAVALVRRRQRTAAGRTEEGR
jgi:membrane protein DedA with SNARE-associated domain